jgi:hypothetical protein
MSLEGFSFSLTGGKSLNPGFDYKVRGEWSDKANALYCALR